MEWFSGVELEGEYGEDYFQIACWRYNAPIQNGETIDFWLEYEKDDSVSVQLKIEQFQTG